MATDPTPHRDPRPASAASAASPASPASAASPASPAPPAPDSDGALYTARVDNVGGTSGEVRIHDAAAVRLDGTTAAAGGALALPSGGPSHEAAGFNPEQFLAMAWSTCLGETLKVVLAEHGHEHESWVRIEVELHRDPADGYRFAPRALVEIDGMPDEQAQPLIEAAHARCPVSKLLTGQGDASVTHRITP